MAGGRPTDYTPELAAEICSRLSVGNSMRKVCEDEGMPDRSSIFLWMSKYPEFSSQYANAKLEAAESLAEELFDIADDGRNDWMETLDREGNVVGFKANGESIQRSRLRVDTRKWYLSKIMPKKYGEKSQMELTGANGGAMKHDHAVEWVVQPVKPINET